MKPETIFLLLSLLYAAYRAYIAVFQLERHRKHVESYSDFFSAWPPLFHKIYVADWQVTFFRVSYTLGFLILFFVTIILFLDGSL